MKKDSHLILQAHTICELLAPIGTTTIIRHPDWFGSLPSECNHTRLCR
jgi:hypothetical protein